MKNKFSMTPHNKLKGMSRFGSLKGTPDLTNIVGSTIKLPLISFPEYKTLFEPLARISKILTPVGEVFARVGQKIEKERRLSKIALDNGIIPHRAFLSFYDEETCGDFSLWNNCLVENLDDILTEICSSYPETILQPVREDVFNELISAFKNGNYYSVCRLCVLEIEGLASDIFTTKNRWRYKEWQNLIRNDAIKHAGTIPLSHDFFMLEYEVIRYFSCRVFETKKFDQIHKEDKFEYIFNRHFHAHGYLFEPSQIDGLNSLVLLHNFTKFFSYVRRLEV